MGRPKHQCPCGCGGITGREYLRGHRPVRDVNERFWAKVDKVSEHRVPRMESNCWLWTASTSHGGYGKWWPVSHRRGGKCQDAHTFSWVLHSGPIPEGQCVLHRCDEPRCVRPDHLWLGTKAENNVDMFVKARGRRQNGTHCPNGHALTPDNTYVLKRKYGTSLKCKTCHHAAQKKVYERTKNHRTGTSALPPSR